MLKSVGSKANFWTWNPDDCQQENQMIVDKKTILLSTKNPDDCQQKWVLYVSTLFALDTAFRFAAFIASTRADLTFTMTISQWCKKRNSMKIWHKYTNMAPPWDSPVPKPPWHWLQCCQSASASLAPEGKRNIQPDKLKDKSPLGRAPRLVSQWGRPEFCRWYYNQERKDWWFQKDDKPQSQKCRKMFSPVTHEHHIAQHLNMTILII